MERSRRLIMLYVQAVALTAAAFWTRQAVADEGGCKTYTGPFTSVAVGSPPTGTLGHLGGPLDAKYEFIFTRRLLEPPGSSTQPILSDQSSIRLAAGSITTNVAAFENWLSVRYG